MSGSSAPPGSPTAPAPTRQVWLVLWGAMTMAPVVYAVLAQQVIVPTDPPATFPVLRLAFLGLAVLGFLGASFLMSRAAGPGGWPPGPPASPGQADLVAPAVFQLRSIIAMAFFESVAVYGWVLVLMGGPPLMVLPWCAASIVGLAGIVLPSGLAYWRRYDMLRSGSRPAAIE